MTKCRIWFIIILNKVDDGSKGVRHILPYVMTLLFFMITPCKSALKKLQKIPIGRMI